jgi:uncharacterized LabA/DUF88 family protein
MSDAQKQPELPLLGKMRRVIVFIDGTNLFHAMVECCKIEEIEIERLSQNLCNVNRELKGIRYYYSSFIQSVNPHTYKRQQRYIHNISRFPNVTTVAGKYIRHKLLLPKTTYDKIKNCPTRCIGDDELQGYVEKLTDVNIAVDMVMMALRDEYDTAILISGDGDLVPAINAVKELSGQDGKKKKVQVAAFDNEFRKCYDLKNAASSFIRLDQYFPIRRKKKP